MLATKRSAGIAPAVNLTKGRHHQKSKTEVLVTTQKGLMYPKYFKNNNKTMLSKTSKQQQEKD